MKRSPFLALFISANIGFVLLHLHKQSQFIQLSYTKQKLEVQMNNLNKQKQELTHQLYTFYDRTRVLNYAKKELNMSHAKVGQFKKMSNTVANLQAIEIPETIEIKTLEEENTIIISQNQSDVSINTEPTETI